MIISSKIKRAHTDRLSPAAQTNQKYAVACCVILFLISMLVVVLHTRPLLSTVIIGTKIEGGVILVLLSFWSALVAIVSDTRHGLATDSSGSISNGNLYYFSWAGLATGVSLMLSFVRSVWGIDVTTELQNRAKRLHYWVWLAIFGLIQMGSSARLFDNHCGRSNSGLGEAEMGTIKFCRRCQLGIVLGILSAVASTAVAGVKMGVARSGTVPFLFTTEMILSGMMLVSQAVGIALLTSVEGPGAPPNTLFYSSWGSLAVGLVLTASCVEDWSAAKGTMRAGNGGKDSVLGEEGERLELRDGIS
mmetsp:Transcript_25755/g.47357  ORF Transcript_25755/g.47357 Transcript_25755/m.47357 type:complete len:304 (-) Transcript_25755:1636-2547(-)